MSDVAVELITEWLEKQETPPLRSKQLLQQAVSTDNEPQEAATTISNLINAYILLTYRGTGSKQLQQMANDCKVSLQEIQAVLENRPISEEAAGVFASKLQMSLDEFLAQYPVVRSSAGHQRSDRRKELRDRG